MAKDTSLRELASECIDAAAAMEEALEARKLSGLYYAAKRMNRAAAAISARLAHVDDDELSAFARAEVDRALSTEDGK